jgi:ribosomal protein L11 methyltransferase
MKARTFWKVAIVTTPEAEDAVAELLQHSFEQSASAYTDVETVETTVSIYLERRPNWSGSHKILLNELERIKSFGLDIGAGKISLNRLAKEDWSNSWKRHFKPIEVGSALLIQPSWSKRHPRSGQAVVVLDPGLSFGTGQHATTGFCLQQLVEYRSGFRVSGIGLKQKRAGQKTKNAKQSFLDIGTGSGILAIAAVKLGYVPVEAFDFDPDAVQISRSNARQNGVLKKIHITRADITKLSRRGSVKYDVICANLISNLLIQERERIISRLHPRGRLVLAGILNIEFHLVQTAYEAVGLKLIASSTEKEWRSGTFGFL